ncbi:MAG: radical SAM family heme chaperone HemW [Ruminococcaceae bacterium]|nr:radical SAM family heme chaperone HemW [Oscillospiraceae bacterium]
MNKLGIYLHTPFCVRKCSYCDFYSAPGSPEEADAYADALCAQIRGAKDARPVDTVYFGGGTPTTLGVRNLVRILNAVRETFPVDEDAEITLEANPGDLCLRPMDGGEQRITALAILHAAGFNRLSFGIQSSDAEELRLLGRRHSFPEAAETAALARAVGFENLTLDLMYGLPGQRMETWEQSVRDILSLSPEHISCYGLKLEPGTPLFARESDLPEDEACLSQYLRMIELLEAAGYRQYEISNFALPGRQSRHNRKYWCGAPYLGFGPSAHSYSGGVRWAWEDDRAAFTRGIYREKERIALTARDDLEEQIMLSLRTTAGLSPAVLPEELQAGAQHILEKYIPHGLVRRQEGRYVLTPRGMFVSNHIIGELFDLIPD